MAYLTSQDIGHDEPFTIYHAQFEIATIVEQLKNYNNPPLYEILLHFWVKLFGISPAVVRLFPLIFASFSPVALYYFAKRFFSVRIAITSSLLLTFSSLLLYYAHDCRVYSFFVLLSILAMHFFLCLLQEKKRATAILFILSNSLLMYSHYFGFFILLFQGLYLLFFFRNKMVQFLIFYWILLLLYLPHIVTLLKRAGDSMNNGTWLDSPDGIENLYNMLWAFSNFPFITVGCILLFTFGIVFWIKNNNHLKINKNFVLILIWFLIPFLGMFLISFWVPMYISRYLIFALPAYYMIIAFCIEEIFQNINFRNYLLTAFAICFAYTLDMNPDKNQKIGEIVEVVNKVKDPVTMVVVSSKDFLPSFAYYYNRNYFASVSDQREYSLTDSLLKTEHVFFLNRCEDFNWIRKTAYKKLIYIGIGNAFNFYENKSCDQKSKYTLLYKKKFSDNYSMCLFKISSL